MRTDNYYDEEFEPWVRGIRSIGAMLAQRPMINAQAAETRARTSLLGAEEGNQRAQTRYHDAQTGKTTQETALLKSDYDGEQQIARGLRVLSQNPNDTNAIADVMEGTGKGFRHNPQQTAKGIGTMLAILKSRSGGSVADAAALADPNAAYRTDQQLAGSKYSADQRLAGTQYSADTRPIVVPRNATAFDRSGNVIAAAPQDLGIGHRLFLPSDTQVSYGPEPAVQGAEQPPHTAAAEQERLRLVRTAVAQDARDRTTNAPAMLRTFDAMTGRTNTLPAGGVGPQEPLLYGSESEARAAGHKAGSIVRIAGVGIVRLK